MGKPRPPERTRGRRLFTQSGPKTRQGAGYNMHWERIVEFRVSIDFGIDWDFVIVRKRMLKPVVTENLTLFQCGLSRASQSAEEETLE